MTYAVILTARARSSTRRPHHGHRGPPRRCPLERSYGWSYHPRPLLLCVIVSGWIRYRMLRVRTGWPGRGWWRWSCTLVSACDDDGARYIRGRVESSRRRLVNDDGVLAGGSIEEDDWAGGIGRQR
jgi:hypothetical protein